MLSYLIVQLADVSPEMCTQALTTDIIACLFSPALCFRIEIIPRIPRKPQAKYRSRSPGSTVNIRLIRGALIERGWDRGKGGGRRRGGRDSFQSFLGTRLPVSVLVSRQSTRQEQTAASECKVRTMPLIFGRPPLFPGHIHLSTSKPTSDTFCSRRVRATKPEGRSSWPILGLFRASHPDASPSRQGSHRASAKKRLNLNGEWRNSRVSAADHGQ